MARRFGDYLVEVEDFVRHRPDDDMRPRVGRWINRGLRIITRGFTWKWAEIQRTTPSVLDKPNYYRLNDDFEEMISVQIAEKDTDGLPENIGTPLQVSFVKRKDVIVPDQTLTAETPTQATITGGTLLLTPGFEDEDHFIVSRYYREPPLLEFDDQLPILPGIYADVLIDAALIVGSRWIYDDKGDNDRIRRDYLEGFGAMMRKEKGDISHQDRVRIDSSLAALVRRGGSAGRFT